MNLKKFLYSIDITKFINASVSGNLQKIYFKSVIDVSINSVINSPTNSDKPRNLYSSWKQAVWLMVIVYKRILYYDLSHTSSYNWR